MADDYPYYIDVRRRKSLWQVSESSLFFGVFDRQLMRGKFQDTLNYAKELARKYKDCKLTVYTSDGNVMFTERFGKTVTERIKEVK